MNEDIIARAGKIISERGLAEHGGCVLAQIDLDGYPTAATISPSKVEGIERITFCTGEGSNWIKRLEHCGRACVCFNSIPECYNISLIGEIEAVTDLDVKREMWYEGMGHYFSGPEDPGYAVLRFQTKRYSIMLSEAEGTFRGAL